MWHWAAKLTGPFPCSHESRGGDLLLVHLCAGFCWPQGQFPPISQPVMLWQEKLCAFLVCGIPPGSFHGLRKTILTTGDIGCSMVCVCLSVDHFFSTSFSMLIRMLFKNFFEILKFGFNTNLFFLLRKYSADLLAAVKLSCLSF